jgi:hypothetical protein
VPETYRTGKWSQPGVPHKGWECIGCHDLGKPTAICQMCETRDIRYVHEMAHPEYEGYLEVGCVCAEHMEAVSSAPRLRERRLQNQAMRRRKWCTRRWYESYSGQQELRTNGWEFSIFPFKGGWSAIVTHAASGFRRPSRRYYATADDAKLAAFDVMAHRLCRMREKEERDL